MVANTDPYNQIGDLYLSLISPESAQARDLNDPVVSSWLAENMPDQAKILDAGCGLGFQTVALHNGALGKHIDKRFRVYASDFSQAMLDIAIANGAAAGIDKSRYRQCSFADLGKPQEGWQDFDAVMVIYGLYTFPDSVEVEDFDAYLLRCYTGLTSLLKPGGHLIFNVRDWSTFSKNGKHEQVYESTHGATTYRCHYSWTFNNSGHHTATLLMSNSEGKSQTTSINYAHRSPEQYIEIASKCGLAPVFTGHHCEDESGYHVIALKKIS